MTTRNPRDPTAASLPALIRRIAAKDGDALRSLYELTAPKLLNIALRMLGRRDWAEDVLQDAFINIWRFASQYDTATATPMAWITVIVRNRTLDYLRQQKALVASAGIEWSTKLDDELAADVPGPFELAVGNQQARRLAAGLTRLEVSQRRAVTLAYLCDLTHAEVAEVMNVPLGTVKTWIRRGTQQLKFELADLPVVVPDH